MGQVDAARPRGQELSVRAHVCAGSRTFWVGDLISYRSGLWIIKGLFLSAGRTGAPEMYYILAEDSPSLDTDTGVDAR